MAIEDEITNVAQPTMGTRAPLVAATAEASSADGDARWARTVPLTDSARSAVAALVRAIDLFDPAAGRQAALRAGIVDHVATRLGFEPEVHAQATVAALLADVSQLVLHRSTWPDDERIDLADAVLAARLLESLRDLGMVSQTIRQLGESWDGTGGPRGLSGESIALPTRVAAIAVTVVGRPELGVAPRWAANIARARRAAGSTLDPDLVDRITEILSSEPLGSRVPNVDAVLTLLDAMTVSPSLPSPVETLVTVGEAIEAADHIEDVLTLLTDRACEALRASTVTIGRLDVESNTVQVVVNSGEISSESEHFPADEIYPIAEHPRFAGVLEGHTSAQRVMNADLTTADDLTTRGVQSEIMAPIAIRDQIWGAVWASSRPGQRLLDESDISTLRLVAAQIAAGVAQAERFAELETLALRDPLTGLGNRRVLEEKLDEVFSRPAIERQDTAVIMCDVDGLKAVNDSLGHEAGDSILVQAAIALRSAVADISSASVCRIGGDEFCIVIDGGGLLSAQPVAERAQRLFALGGDGTSRSLSCGVAVATISMSTPGDLLRAADQQQYEEKRARKAALGEFLPERTAARGPRRRTRRDA